MILDEFCESYDIVYPFQITRFRSLYDHHWEGEYTFLGEAHNFWEFIYVLDGEIESVQDGKIYLLKPGNFISCPPMVFHSSRNLGASTRCFNFSFDHIGSMPPNISKGIIHLAPEECVELENIFLRLSEAFHKVPSDSLTGAEAAYAMASFLIRLSQHHMPSDQLAKNRSSTMYQKLVETMQSALYENLSMQEIALRNAISITTMKELFRKYSGYGPKRYYSEMRGLEARRLLENGTEIVEIADSLKFSSPNYFSFCFKKQFGVAPGQYRKSIEK